MKAMGDWAEPSMQMWRLLDGPRAARGLISSLGFGLLSREDGVFVESIL
jgi:hypothetical protein